MSIRESKNKFLSGNWYPVKETFSDELKISGELPKELSGLFLRNGPNPKEPINHENYHPFFGDGMIHGIRIEDGKALWYKKNSFPRFTINILFLYHRDCHANFCLLLT